MVSYLVKRRLSSQNIRFQKFCSFSYFFHILFCSRRIAIVFTTPLETPLLRMQYANPYILLGIIVGINPYDVVRHIKEFCGVQTGQIFLGVITWVCAGLLLGGCSRKNIKCTFSFNIKYYKSILRKPLDSGQLYLTDDFEFIFQLILLY